MLQFDSINISLAIVGIITMFFGFSIYLSGFSDRKNRHFIYFIASVFAWDFSMFFYRAAESVAASVFWAQLLYFSASTIGVTFYILSHIFIDKNYVFSLKKKLFIALPYAVMIVITLVPNLLIRDVIFHLGAEKEIVFTHWMHILYAIHFNTYATLAFVNYIYKYRHSAGREKMQLAYVIVGSLLTATISNTTNLILPISGNFDYNWFGQITILILVIVIFYAVVKHHLFNVKIIATEIFVFSLWGFVIMRMLLQSEPIDRFVDALLFLIIFIVGILLIKSVIKEVRQKEHLALLTQELREKTQILEDLSSINNHQQRTPLTVIKGGIDMLENSKLTKKERQHIYDQMKDRVERMLHTLTEFSVGFSPKPKPVNVQPEKGDLEKAVRMIYDEHFELEKSRQRRDSKYKKLSFEYEAPKKPLPPVWFDKNNTLHILSNLLDNAVSYSDSGTIKISYDLDDDHAIVKITDNGIGITPEEKKIIFEKAKRGERAKKRYAFGSGLGLFLARQIAEESGGSLDVESTGAGKGSTFILKLPLYKGQDKKASGRDVNKTS